MAEKRWTELTSRGATIPDWRRSIGYVDEARSVLVINQGKDTWGRSHPR